MHIIYGFFPNERYVKGPYILFGRDNMFMRGRTHTSQELSIKVFTFIGLYTPQYHKDIIHVMIFKAPFHGIFFTGKACKVSKKAIVQKI